MIELHQHAAGVLLNVRAAPGARRNALCGELNGALKIAVTKAPEKSKANKAIIEVLCKALGLKKSQVDLVSGESSREKRLLVRGVTTNELAERLAAALENAPPLSAR